MYDRLRLALLALTLIAACARRLDPDIVITVAIPMNVAQAWAADTYPPATYRLERIWLQSIPESGETCLMTQRLDRGSVESYRWTSTGLVLYIRREVPAIGAHMQWVFNRGPNEASLSYPVLRGNDADSAYARLMNAAACSMTF